MVEAIMAGVAVAAGAAILTLRQPGQLDGGSTAVAGPVALVDLATADLPCPWCRSATDEGDTHCPQCHQPFG